MIQVGVLGASGFVGSRLVEIFHLEQVAKVIPIVRSTNSLARLARFSLEWRISDALDRNALVEAFRGCDVVIHAIVGPDEVIVDASRAAYLAAQEAGVRRIVYVSTTSVHGQNPPPGTDESSPLHTRHPFAYNNAKVRAEQNFVRLRKTGNVELVVLRPGIVFGPRNQRISGIAESILERKAYVVRGAGICNTIYVDNLVHALRLAMSAPADGQVFIVGDKETITWHDLYRRVSAALGSEWPIPEVEPSSAVPEHVSLPDRLKEFDVIRAAVPHIPRAWKLRARETLGALGGLWAAAREGAGHRQADPWQLPTQGRPVVSLETALLHQCRHRFSYAKASSGLGYEAVVSLDEGLRRTVAWLKFVNFPVVE